MWRSISGIFTGFLLGAKENILVLWIMIRVLLFSAGSGFDEEVSGIWWGRISLLALSVEKHSR